MGIKHSKNVKIHLIVEDDFLNAQVLSKYLNKLKISNDIASNGKDALKKSKQTDYDVIWMDLKIPKINGCECVYKLRKNSYKGKIVIVSGLMHKCVQKLHDTKQIDDIMVKPFNYDRVRTLCIKYNQL